MRVTGMWASYRAIILEPGRACQKYLDGFAERTTFGGHRCEKESGERKDGVQKMSHQKGYVKSLSLPERQSCIRMHDAHHPAAIKYEPRTFGVVGIRQ
jgi:hypothetical protein